VTVSKDGTATQAACVALHVITTIIGATCVARAAAGVTTQKWEVVFHGLLMAVVRHGLYKTGPPPTS
jgi:hypothetical protein